MDLSRRDFLSLGAAAIVVPTVPAGAIGLGAEIPPTQISAQIAVQVTREWFGDGEFGNVMGAFAHGHHPPAAMARNTIDELLSDGGIEDVFPADMFDAEGELISEEAAIALLVPKVRHTHAVLEHPEDEHGTSWILHDKVSADAKGAFAATVIDL